MAVIGAPAEGQRRKGPFYTQLYFQVVAAIIIGGTIGWLYKINWFGAVLGLTALDNSVPWVKDFLKPLGDGFVALVKMIIPIVIFVTIAVGVGGMRDMGKLGRVALKALGYFLAVSSLALVIGLIVGNLIQPGNGMNADPAHYSAGDIAAVQGYAEKAHDTTVVGFLLSIIPKTFISAFTDGSTLQVLFVAILAGVGLAMAGERAQKALDVLTSVSQAIFKMVAILMRAAPIGAFGAFAFIIADLGLDAIQRLLLLVAAVYLTSIIFIIVVLGAIGFLAGFSIFSLLRYLKDELFLVLGTSSSESALPALMEKMERAGCARPVVGLVVPTGYSFNLDGTNIYMTMAALFIAQAMNIHLPIEQQVILLAVAMLSSKGAAGVTGAGFIALAATLESVMGPDGNPMIPVAGMVIILGVDRFLSECRALTNFIGNAVATIVVSGWEGALDRDKLKLAMAGKAPPLAAQPIEQDTD
ncbi:MAG: C4-dicarboxylate transporter DctA [Hyphomonadaceae bacterium]|nr:C4-dicarboxylate transporter DctA [Hyphomonadaceae bacterium]